MTEPPIALITGASAGLGAAFARALAARGCDLILVARRAERLENLAQEVMHQTGLKAEPLCADLTRPEDLHRVEERIRRLPHLDYLINNAGFGVRGLFADSDLERQTAMANLHMLATMRLTRVALPGMLDRRRGNIINVSSLSAFITLPGSIHYSATKAYLNTFSEGLAREVSCLGIRVQALCPGFTLTEFHATPAYVSMRAYERIPRFFWDPPEKVVEASLRHLPHGPVVFVPFFKNQVLAFGARLGLTGLFYRIVIGWFRRRPPM
ncbi:MAG TPA: KR domain-containing protein [Anaerolinea thermolimosa]|uniref:KR domain-containing protein n=1 Tax=Anaerolinea thermolimosa TaxID=229919 RepID=A0A3D1JFI6_9CHLR|nr:SDR family NAD(P)-dependent oxidoreductase [Anaerolinea thermolimosa]GAP08403.1 short-chain dehydrogenase of various substrate specificities [Anaerolinea thermolimosa]HCE16985.1 KR domain-containing protein [Anaerolinea thermolimosa]